MQLVISPKQRWFSINFRELLSYKDLFYFLAWRDIKVRYKQTTVGILWAFFVPIITMVIFSVFFGNFAGMSSDGLPYPIFVYTGLIFWNFFSQAISNSSQSLVASQEIVKKIYFPKVILPATSIFVTVIDFAISLLVLVGLIIYYRFIPNPISILIIPVLIFITYVLSLGLGLLLSALNVKYRDVRYIVPFFIQLLLFLTPVIYPTSIVSAQWRWILYFNPISGVIENARAVVLNNGGVEWTSLGIGTLVSIVLLMVGLFYFKKTERFFADII